jgi:hypothetical protein
MHGRVFYLRELRYGFADDRFCVRIDPFLESLRELEDPEFRITLGGAEELTVVVALQRGRLREYAVEEAKACLLHPGNIVEAAFDQILEVSVKREHIKLKGQKTLRLGIALWHGGLPVDVLPAAGFLEIPLGEDECAWPIKE